MAQRKKLVVLQFAATGTKQAAQAFGRSLRSLF